MRMSKVALNVICCETAIRLETGAKRKCRGRAQNVADDPKRTNINLSANTLAGFNSHQIAHTSAVVVSMKYQLL